MRKMLKFSALVLILGLVFGLVGCDGNDNQNDNNNNNQNNDDDEIIVSFESFSPPSIYVDNNTGEKLVAFKNSLNPNYLISGIPANAAKHGLAKNGSLFSTTGDFALVLITEEEFENNKTNLVNASIFTVLYAFYNHETINNNSYNISSQSEGSGRITLTNQTDWNIEIRKDAPGGEVIGYIAPQTVNMVLRVKAPGDYSLYPVLKKYYTEKESPEYNIIFEAVPIYASYPIIAYSKDFALTTADGTASWNLSEINNKNAFRLISGGFFLKIDNKANTAVLFIRDDEEQVTSMGIRDIVPETSGFYIVNSIRDPDGSYPYSQTISQLKIGTLQDSIEIPPIAFKRDHLYVITVTGEDASNLVIKDPIIESQHTVDIEVRFGF
jgi:hypothetical protein